MGTVESRIGGERRPAVRTTPEVIDLQRALRAMLDAGDRSAAREVRVGLRILRRRFDEVRPQGVERHDPRRDRRGEALGQVRAERLVLESLDVTRRPVVEQHDAEDVTVGVVGLDARRRRTTDEEADLELDVERRVGASRGGPSPAAMSPSGRTTGVPLTTTVRGRGRGRRRAADASSAAAARASGRRIGPMFVAWWSDE